MFCYKCGNEISNDSSFCPNCGAPQNNQPAKEATSQPVAEMCEIYVTATKPTGQLYHKNYYVYVDNTMYKCSSSDKSPLVIKVTPTAHQITASYFEQKTKDKASKLGDAASDVGTLAALGSRTRDGAGVALGLGTMVWGVAKMSSSIIGKSQDSINVNMSSQKTLKLKILANSLGKVRIVEE